MKSHPMVNPDWIEQQNRRLQEAERAFSSRDFHKCLKALGDCPWEEAVELRRRCVVESVSPGEFGRIPNVIALADGTYQLGGQLGDELSSVARVASDLRIMVVFIVPQEVHSALTTLRFHRSFPESFGRVLAKSAFLMHNSGRPELALGILETALELDVENPSIPLSLRNLRAREVAAAPDTKPWLTSYLDDLFESRPRITLEQYRQQKESELRRAIRAGSIERDDVRQWLEEASLSQIVEFSDPAFLALLAKRNPDLMLRILRDHEGDISDVLYALLRSGPDAERTLESILKAVWKPDSAEAEIKQALAIACGMSFLSSKSEHPRFLKLITALPSYASPSETGRTLRKLHDTARKNGEVASTANVSRPDWVVNLDSSTTTGTTWTFAGGVDRPAVSICRESLTAEQVKKSFFKEGTIERIGLAQANELILVEVSSDCGSDTTYRCQMEFHSWNGVLLTLTDLVSERFADWDRALPTRRSEIVSKLQVFANWLGVSLRSRRDNRS